MLFLIVFNCFSLLPLDKDCLPLYNNRMRQKTARTKTVPIRVRPETREKLHKLKNPGQSLNGFITQLIDFWEKEKLKEEAAQVYQK